LLYRFIINTSVQRKLILFASALAFSKNVSFSSSSSSEANFYSQATIKFLF